MIVLQGHLSSVLLSVCLARVGVCGVVERGEHVLVTEYRQRRVRSRRHQQQQPHLQQQQQH